MYMSVSLWKLFKSSYPGEMHRGLHLSESLQISFATTKNIKMKQTEIEMRIVAIVSFLKGQRVILKCNIVGIH